MSNMVFEDYFDRFLNERGFQKGSNSKITLLKDEYQNLKKKAEKYEALVEEHKKVKTWNDQLLKELDDMKEDARKFKELEEEKEKFLHSLLRIRADFDNYKKRNEQEYADYKAYALERVLKKLINHYDDLIRAMNLIKMVEGMDGIGKGFEIIVNNFKKILEEEGVKPIISEGEKFDPYKHEVLIVEDGRDDLPENTITEELEKGYYLNNKILRPAKVKISKKSHIVNLENK
ncbi:MAG: nucleotide exchange factor GrpE [Promethearchaeota archaeon]